MKYVFLTIILIAFVACSVNHEVSGEAKFILDEEICDVYSVQTDKEVCMDIVLTFLLTKDINKGFCETYQTVEKREACLDLITGIVRKLTDKL